MRQLKPLSLPIILNIVPLGASAGVTGCGLSGSAAANGLSGLYKCPYLKDYPAPLANDHECMNNCSGQITDQSSCDYYFDDLSSALWACYGHGVKPCTLLL